MSTKKYRPVNQEHYEPFPTNSVMEFHELTGNNIEKYPTIPAPKRTALRVSLISEELQELKDALVQQDIVEIADALCDLQYVLSGSVIEFGLGNIWADLFNEVHRSNMSKACKNLDEVKATMEWYHEQGHTNLDYITTKTGDLFVIDLDNNRKTLKSKYYSPANLGAIIAKAMEDAPDETDMPEGLESQWEDDINRPKL